MTETIALTGNRGIAGDPLPDPWSDELAHDITTRAAAAAHRERAAVPPSMDDMPPGPVLALMLSAIDPMALSAHDRVIALRAHRRLESHHAAKCYEAMAAIEQAFIQEDVDAGVTWDNEVETAEQAAAEIRVALNLTRRAADSDFAFARDLRERLPAVYGLLESGVIDVRRAKTIERHTIDLPCTTARAIAERVLSDAGISTTGELAARLQRLRMEVHPAEAEDRMARATEDRKVVVETTPNGTAHLHAFDLEPHVATGIMRRLTRAARRLKTGTEPRTTDQLRADILGDALLRDGSGSVAEAGEEARTSRFGRPDPGGVTITVDLATLARLNEHPGDLAGYGPVIADLARKVTARQRDATWRYRVVDGHDTVAEGLTRRRPSNDLRRRVELETPTCVFPGCRMPATECDLDHRKAWTDGGRTVADNLDPLCRHDHRLKGPGRWRSTVDANGGRVWISPLGHRYPRHRYPTQSHQPSDDPP